MLQKIGNFLYDHRYKLLAGVSFCFAGYAFYEYVNDDSRVKLSAFIQALQKNQIDEVIVSGGSVIFRSEVSEWYHSTLGTFPLSQLFALLKSAPGVTFSCEEDRQILEKTLGLALSAGMCYFTFSMLNPEKGLNIGKTPEIVDNDQTFDSFYGCEQVKAKLIEIVDFLRNKEKFKKLGGRVRKGILLSGPPGTGKTMLAKTLANEAKLPFLQTCASQFEEIYVGVGPKKIRQIFKAARKCPEGCIVFIDELDAIGSRSDGIRFSRQTTATINQLLSELDGFEETEKVVVVGATNRPELVDKAIIRAGRFDIKVKLELPSENDRRGIMKTLLLKKAVPHELSEKVIEEVAKSSVKWSGADIEALINEGIFRAVRQSSLLLQDEHIRSALQELLANRVENS